MQSSRRKRERGENDDHGGAAQSRKKFESNESTTAPSEFGAASSSEAIAAEVSPPTNETVTASEQSQPMQDARPTEGTNGGNDHSEATTNELAAMDTVSDEQQGHSASWEGTGKGTREERILALISHRKILLERMKQCKVAADTRLKRNAEKRQKAGDDGTSGEAKKDEGQATSDSEEIERYRETCRQANEATKKQRADSIVEKRSSVSLRRGSSVGKRMAAAISTLGEESSSLSAGEGNATATASSLETLPLQSSQVPLPNSKQAALHAAQQRAQTTKSEQNLAMPTISQNYGQQIQRKRSASTNQRAPRSYPGLSAAHATRGATSMPMHAGTGTTGLPFTRRAYPTVNFPEARALREKRDGIRNKLNALIHERLERIQQTNNANNIDSPGVDQLKSFASFVEKPSPEDYRLALPRMVLERGVNSPSKLPRRQKTHWDYLLEEMRWMSTDFVEERKWKAASGRTLGSAVVSNRLNAVAPVERSGQDVKVGEDDAADEKKKVSSSDDGDEVPSMSAEIPEDLGAREYTSPSFSDSRSAQSAAHIMSHMIAEVWTGTIDCGLLANSDEPLVSALHRHKKVRKSLEAEENNDDSKDAEEDKENGSAPTKIDDTEKSAETGENSHKDTTEARSAPLSNDEITEIINSAIERVKSRTARRNRAKAPKEPLSLSASQRKASEFAEFVWGGDDSAALCLEGPGVSGKTVLSCSLIWKRRSEGPQLLVCSPSRVIRWYRELGRFDDLNLFVFGLQCGLSSPIPEAKPRSEFQESDVVICDFASLVQVEEGSKATKLDLSSFATVVLDARFPTEHVAEALDSAVSTTNGAKLSRTSIADSLIPPQLISHQWWAALLDSLRSCNARRLLIDNSECSFLREHDRLAGSGLTERQRLDTLAAMAAFVVGPNIFRCTESRSVQHKVVSWAKHSAKEGDARKRPIYSEVYGVIADAAFPFRCTMDSEAGDTENVFDARLCSLSPSQRQAYEDCCVGVRGALAFGNITDYAEDGNETPESYEHAVQGLMKLRRVCVHSQLEDLVNRWCASVPTLSASTGRSRFVKAADMSVSQPQTDIANDILCGSAKMRELVAILRDDCGFSATEDAVLLQSGLDTEKKAKSKSAKKKTARKKVAILAMLPEVQLLVSILLNAVGIRHELLGASAFLRGDGSSSDTVAPYASHSDSRFARNLDSAMAWISSQLSLLRFGSDGSELGNDLSTATQTRMSCEIVIASPVLVGADNGGLGIEAADLVVCLDEDWSGRDSFLIDRITKRCLFAHNLNNADNGKKDESGCSFIRLVCEETCEHVFLSNFGADNTGCNEKWNIDGQGLLSLSSTMKADDIPLADMGDEPEGNVEGHFRFPALSVLRFRGKVLSSVLLPVNNIPPVFATGDPVRFLPFQDWEHGGKRSLSITLARTLIAEESRSMLAFWAPGNCSNHGSMNGVDGIAIPPFPTDFPSAIVTRHDMLVGTSRLYVDRTVKRLVLLGGSGLHTDSTYGRLATPSVQTTAGPGPGRGRNLVDTWQKVGPNCKPGDLVPSLLSYGTENAAQSERVTASKKSEASALSLSTTARTNMFTDSYCSSRTAVSNVIMDGNQGFEPLAYFPPLFPAILEASDLAQADVARRRPFSGSQMDQRNMPCFLPDSDVALGKRKEPPEAYPMNVASKRPRIGTGPAMVQDSLSVPAQRAMVDSRGLPPSDSTPRNDASIVTEDEGSQWDQYSMFDMGEDYGLLGVGAVSSTGDAARHASTTSVDAIGYSIWTDPYEPDALDQAVFSSNVPCDAEEIAAYVRGETDDSFLDTMLLFVAKRAPSSFAGMTAPSTSHLGGLSFQGANSAWLPRAEMPGSAVTNAVGGADGRKKRKSQTQSSMPMGAFGGVNPVADISNRSMNPYGVPPMLHSSKGRESYRSKILASILARQGGGRASLFQVPSFLLASIRIRDDVLRRVLRQSQSLSLGRRISHSGRRTWTRACYRMSPSSTRHTGDSAVIAAKNQEIKMLRAPAPVDFGPFVAGYICSPYAACGAVPRTAATGISLPMGVKLPRRSSEKQVKGWSEVEDKKLKESVFRYGLNWYLVASAVSDVDAVSRRADPTKETPLFYVQSKSPGQCQERWKRLVELDPDLMGKLHDVERSNHETASSPPSSSELKDDYSARRIEQKLSTKAPLVGNVGGGLSLVLSSKMFVEKDGDHVMSDEKEKTDEKPASTEKKKKSFAALRSAAKKKIDLPLQIPGSTDGEKPSLVASHPSHAQAVQAAIAGTAGGKSEMWPLQILDLEDKNRAARMQAGRMAPPGAPVPPVMRSPGRPHPSASSRQQQPRPPHASFQVPHGGMPHQGYPAANGAPGPLRGPPPSSSSGQPRSSK